MVLAMTQRAVLYGRVSQDRSEGKSVDDQLAECRAWAHRESWRIVAEHRDDGISASRYANGKARPGWQSVTDLITSGGVDLLVVWEISRATRDRFVWASLLAACQERKVKIASGGRIHDTADPDDAFMLDIQGAQAVRESEKTRARILRSVRARAAAGAPHGRIAYGYRRIYDPETRKLVSQEPDLETAPVVCEIARRCLAGEATHAVAADLNSRGVTAPQGGRWDLTQVKRIAISPTYAALRSHNGEITGPATWPALISEADHWALVERLTNPARKTVRDGSIKHLLVGIALCGVCGAPCRRVKNRNTPSYMCGQGFCVARAQAPTDAYVSDVVIARLSREDVHDLLIEQPEVSEAAARLTALRNQRSRLKEKVKDCSIDVDTYADIDASLRDQITTLERQLRPKGIPQALTDLAGRPDVAACWNGLSVPQRRELIRVLLVPRILPTGKGARQFDPDRIEIMWRTG
jgi:site-specific DNA recombinase